MGKISFGTKTSRASINAICDNLGVLVKKSKLVFKIHLDENSSHFLTKKTCKKVLRERE